jgi:hypothetical protein
MENIKKNKGKGFAQASSVIALSSLEESIESNKTEKTSAFLKNIGAIDFLTKMESAEAGNKRINDDISDSSVASQPASSSSVFYEDKAEQEIEEREKNALDIWLEKVKNSEKLEGSRYTYINADIVDVITKVRHATGISQNHLINYIILDWIKEHTVHLKYLFNSKRNKFLIDI